MKGGHNSRIAQNAPFQSSYDAKTVGGRIRRYREMRGLTQEEAAELAGRSLRFYADIERGACGMSVDTLLVLCAMYEITPDSLLLPQKPTLNGAYQHKVINRLSALDER